MGFKVRRLETLKRVRCAQCSDLDWFGLANAPRASYRLLAHVDIQTWFDEKYPRRCRQRNTDGGRFGRHQKDFDVVRCLKTLDGIGAAIWRHASLDGHVRYRICIQARAHQVHDTSVLCEYHAFLIAAVYQVQQTTNFEGCSVGRNFPMQAHWHGYGIAQVVHRRPQLLSRRRWNFAGDLKLAQHAISGRFPTQRAAPLHIVFVRRLDALVAKHMLAGRQCWMFHHVATYRTRFIALEPAIDDPAQGLVVLGRPQRLDKRIDRVRRRVSTVVLLQCPVDVCRIERVVCGCQT